uniref:NAD-dependent epimerase/dehydratase family protein n=1 Tax=Cohnella candidum TaxID=2674991 RepID=A0A3G3K289_9BACL|nr:NAD-dependent epimerase/dehydratase family protein [Cohnella candidum]
MNCLVLGGTGFIGSHLCLDLLEKGHRVTVFAKSAFHPVLKEMNAYNGFAFIQGDLDNQDLMARTVQGQDLIFHLVSSTTPKVANDNPSHDVATNVVGTLHLLDLAKNSGVKKIVYASSGGTVYGKPAVVPIPEEHPTWPTNSYAIHKLTNEKYLHMYHELYGLDYSVLRISNPFGERQRVGTGQGVIANFLSKAYRNETLEIWGDGKVIRDYVYIEDVVAALVRVMDETGSHKVFNIGSGEGKSLTDVVSAIEIVTGKLLEVRFLPGRNFDVPVNILDIRKAKQELNWEPRVDFVEGLKRTAAFYQFEQIVK